MTALGHQAPTPGRLAAHPFGPLIEQRPSRESRSRLRIIAFNARGGRRFDGIVSCLRRPPLDEASVILLCEADVGLGRSGRRMIAFDLAAELGMSCAYIAEYGLKDSRGEIAAYLGNAILCVEPLHDVTLIPMPQPEGFWRRSPEWFRRYRRVGGPVGLVANTAFAGRPVRLCVAHLDSRCEPERRSRQMEVLLQELPADSPTILGGDFNTTTTELRTPRGIFTATAGMLFNPGRFRSPERYEPLFRHLADADFQIDGANASGRPTFTFTQFIPPLFRPRLDWIALRGLAPVPDSAMVIPARLRLGSPRVSDHDFIVVDVDL